MKWLMIITCLGFLCACGKNDNSSLESRIAVLESASVMPLAPVQVIEQKSIDWARWASVIVTLLAVFTSLWLASRDRIIRLVVEPKLDGDDLIVSVSNCGRRDAVVVSVETYLKCSKGKITNSIFGGGKAQDKLEDGDFKLYESKGFLLSCKESTESLSKFKRVLLNVGIISFVVETRVSTGKKYSASIRLS